MQVTFRNKEVENPVARFFVLCLLVVMAIFTVICGVVGGVLGIVLLIVFFPIWVPVHFILKACGLNGFYRRFENNFEIKLDRDAFRRQDGR